MPVCHNEHRGFHFSTPTQLWTSQRLTTRYYGDVSYDTTKQNICETHTSNQSQITKPNLIICHLYTAHLRPLSYKYGCSKLPVHQPNPTQPRQITKTIKY